MNNIIHYGIGKDYLPNWGLKEALREIYQNYIDYGEYTTEIVNSNPDFTTVRLNNAYIPEGLEFLRIGTSIKNGNNEAIGKHGEGLKMALLVFGRMDLECIIGVTTSEFEPIFVDNGGIKDCFAIKQTHIPKGIGTFTLQYTCPTVIYNSFVTDIIQDKDRIFTDPANGSIVNRGKGNIYSGGLFITKLENLSHAYDILPSNLTLDRDRSVPRQFDVNYHSSRINAKYGKWSIKDNTYSDTEYIHSVPDHVKKSVTPRRVGNNIEFTYKDGDNDVVVKNPSITSALHNDSFFAKIINKIKSSIIRHLGLYKMLEQFKADHLRTAFIIDDTAIEDFNLILDKVKSGDIN